MIDKIRKSKQIEHALLCDKNDEELMKIHQTLSTLTAYPASMLEKIDKKKTPILFTFKNNIIKHRLIEKHRLNFKEFNLLELLKNRRIL